MLKPVPLNALSLLGGMLLFHSSSTWPDVWLLAGLPAAFLLLFSSGALRRLLGWFLLGSLWPLLWLAPIHLQLPPDWEMEDVTAQGRIASLPERVVRGIRFELDEVNLQRNGHHLPLKGRLQLTWYNTPIHQLQVGETWRFTVRLRRPRGLSNPGALDYERWLFNQQIAARGYIRSAPQAERIGDNLYYPIDRLRQWIGQRFQVLLPSHSLQGILSALAIGERHDITPDQWHILNNTGTTHLMAISGLHIGLVAGLLYFLAFWLWTRSIYLVHYWPAPKAAALLAWLGACAYAALAGFALPTQRALVMLAVVTLAAISARLFNSSRVLALALIVVLLYDPLAPLSAGFWLSFGAVAVLVYLLAGRHRSKTSHLQQGINIQFALSLALLPGTLWFFQSATLVSPLANLIAIPWVSFLVVPFTLLGAGCSMFSDTLASICLQLAATNMDWLWAILDYLSQWQWLQFKLPAPPVWAFGFALPGLALLLAPRGVPGRWLVVPLCLPLISFPHHAPIPGTAWFTLLDVGDGLAAVVRTSENVLIYDTGPRLGVSFDAAQAALIPFLRQQGVRHIETLILSQPNAHHVGGVRSLRQAFPIDQILSGAPEQLALRDVKVCQAGKHWTWSGVDVHILHPPATGYWRDGDDSCVVLVKAGTQSMLFTGDLENSGVQALLPELARHSPIDILVAPQHGWRAMPNSDLLATARPKFVLFSTSYENRYGYPKPETTAQYASQGAIVLNTAHSGAIRFELGSLDELVPQEHRRQSRRYWHTP